MPDIGPKGRVFGRQGKAFNRRHRQPTLGWPISKRLIRQKIAGDRRKHRGERFSTGGKRVHGGHTLISPPLGLNVAPT